MGFRQVSIRLGVVGALAGLWVGGCGYSFQNSRSELLEREGIRRVYVKPLVNNTFKPGVENVVYNALIRTLMAHRRVKVVQNEVDADATLEGVVTVAQFGASGSTNANSLPPAGLTTAPSAVSVATVYTAALSCNFGLQRRGVPPPGRSSTLWTAGFSRAKPFPAANQLDVPGTTSALINESEFERALGDMAVSMMDDVHESMLAMF